MVSPPTKASDMEGCYSWTYERASSYAANPDDVTTNGTYTYPVMMYDADDAAGTFKIAGMTHAPVTVYFETDDDYPYFTINGKGLYYYPSYGFCDLKAVFYFEGNAIYEAGWYSTSPAAWIMEENGKPVIVFHHTTWMYIEIASGTSAGQIISNYWKPSSKMVEDNAYNGVFEHHDYDETHAQYFNIGAPVQISENQHGVVTVNNFLGVYTDASNPIKITLKEDRTWIAESSVLFTDDYYG